jgi:hypothetical protein
MNYTPTIHRVLKLGASASYFAQFISRYHERTKAFTHMPMTFPVILLVDNDDGGKGVFTALIRDEAERLYVPLR